MTDLKRREENINSDTPKKKKHREYMKKWRKANPDKVKEYGNKSYSKNKEKIISRKLDYYHKIKKDEQFKTKRKKWSRERYLKNQERLKNEMKKYYRDNRDKELFQRKKYEKKYPERIKAKNKSQRIKIPKNQSCQICHENPAKIRHHFNYSKPLKVNFLCRSCHKIIHFKNKDG